MFILYVTSQRDDGAEEAPDGVGHAEVYLRVPDPGATHARALAAGARELSPLLARDWGEDVAYSLDPDGYVLAVARARST